MADFQDRIDRLSVEQRALLARRLQHAVTSRSSSATIANASHLVAYFVVRPGHEVPVSGDLRGFLSERLPSFMVPSRFVPLDSFPVLSNGKVDRGSLVRRQNDFPKSVSAESGASLLETQLMRMWRDLLGVFEVGRDDNFFELGGHSLLLPRFADRVRQEFGVELPLGIIFETPTVRELAEVIRSRSARQSWRSLVGIRETGSRRPLYLVHGLGAEIGYFYNLAKYLNPEQPLYGLQPAAEPFNDVEALASSYVHEIRSHQPHGPYLLGGYCIGGCIAFEMARQLVDAGESVRLLAIIDAITPGMALRGPSIRRRLTRAASKSPSEILASLKHYTSRAAKWLAGERKPARKIGELPEWYGVPPAFHDIAARLYRSVANYIPRPYAGDAWLFRSEGDLFDNDLGWGPLVRGRLKIEMVPGDHPNVLKAPHLPETARRLGAVVDAVAERNA